MRLWLPAASALVSFVLSTALVGCGSTGGSAAAQHREEIKMGPGFTFSPATVRIKAGQPLVFQASNSDSMLHDFTVQRIAVSGKKESGSDAHKMPGMGKEPDLHLSVKAGGVGTLAFTAQEKGTYEFYCTEPGHKDGGMKGTLVVE